MTADRKPVPVPDETSEPFWAAASNHVLVVQRCTACGWLAYPPTGTCRSCQADPPAFDWVPVGGTGRLRTWTVVHDALLPGFADEVPYVVAEVELAEQPGLVMITQLVGSDATELTLGMAVRVDFDDRDGVSVPFFVRSTP